jgi:hypothetical protein
MELGAVIGGAIGGAVVLAIIIYFVYRHCRRKTQVTTRLQFGDYVRSISLQEKERAVSLAALAASPTVFSQRYWDAQHDGNGDDYDDDKQEMLLTPSARESGTGGASDAAANGRAYVAALPPMSGGGGTNDENEFSFAALSSAVASPQARKVARM